MDKLQQTTLMCQPEGGKNRSHHVGGGAVPLPCLYSNNSIEHVTPEQEKLNTIQGLTNLLTPSHKKVAHTLYRNVEKLIKGAPSIGHVGFLTLTFADHVTDYKEASRRLNSFKNYLRKSDHFGANITVVEAQKSGRLHYHLVVELKEDIRTGVNFEEFEKKNYRSASPYLRSIWDELRGTRANNWEDGVMFKHGFGRHELTPVRTNAEAMGRYVGKYISKHIGERTEEQKGMRCVNYSRGGNWDSSKFAWVTAGAKEWRQKLSWFARANGCDDFYQLQEKLGSGWAYRYADEIANAYEYVINVVKGKPKAYKSSVIHALETNTTRRNTKKEKILEKGYFAGKKDLERFERQERDKAYGRRAKQENKALVGSIIAKRKADLEEAKKESERQLKAFLNDTGFWDRAEKNIPKDVPY